MRIQLTYPLLRRCLSRVRSPATPRATGAGYLPRPHDRTRCVRSYGASPPHPWLGLTTPPSAAVIAAAPHGGWQAVLPKAAHVQLVPAA